MIIDKKNNDYKYFKAACEAAKNFRTEFNSIADKIAIYDDHIIGCNGAVLFRHDLTVRNAYETGIYDIKTNNAKVIELVKNETYKYPDTSKVMPTCNLSPVTIVTESHIVLQNIAVHHLATMTEGTFKFGLNPDFLKFFEFLAGENEEAVKIEIETTDATYDKYKDITFQFTGSLWTAIIKGFSL